MAEPFGVVAGAIGIAAVFNNAVECFEYIQIGRKFGKDYQSAQLKLDVARVRLSRWGASVNINNQSNVANTLVTVQDAQVAKQVVVQIYELFLEAEHVSSKFKTKNSSSQEIEVYEEREMSEFLALHERMKAQARKRHKETGFLRKTKWALYQKKNLERLIEDLTEYLDNLENVFPDKTNDLEALRRDLAAVEIAETEDVPSLRALENAAEDVDTDVQKLAKVAAEQISSGHSYNNISSEGKAKVLMGNTFAAGYSGPIDTNRSHSYNNVTSKDDTRVMMGDMYGGKSVFDD